MKLEELINDLKNFKHREYGYEMSSDECGMLVEYINLLQKAFFDACEELGSQSYYIETLSHPNQYSWDYKDSEEWQNELLNNHLEKKEW